MESFYRLKIELILFNQMDIAIVTPGTRQPGEHLPTTKATTSLAPV